MLTEGGGAGGCTRSIPGRASANAGERRGRPSPYVIVGAPWLNGRKNLSWAAAVKHIQTSALAWSTSISELNTLVNPICIGSYFYPARLVECGTVLLRNDSTTSSKTCFAIFPAFVSDTGEKYR